MNTTERHSQSSFLDSVLHRRKCPLSKCIKIIYIQMKRGRLMWALLFHYSRCCWSVAFSFLNQGSELCRNKDRKTFWLLFSIRYSKSNLPAMHGKQMFKVHTVSSNLAITVTVSSGEESLGLLVSECPGTSREVLQEQPGRWTKHQGLKHCWIFSIWISRQKS